MKIIITKENAGQRLDKFLVNCGEITNEKNNCLISRGQLQKSIKLGKITVNSKLATPHYKLKNNDLIDIEINFNNNIEQNNTFSEKQPSRKTMEIISETADYLVINKPAGLAVHSQSQKEKTLVDMLLDKYPRVAKVGEDPARPGIVHRLDKDASGLMIIAKTQESFENLKKQFQQRKVIKKYLALVYGKINNESGYINFPIKRSGDGYKMAALPLTKKGKLNQEGRRAETKFTVIKKYINYTLLEIKLKTGRTHQIRVHFAAFDHPLVGDDIYGTAKTRLMNKKLKLDRIFLVAVKLSFTDLAGKLREFKIELPEDLKKLLKIIK